MDSPSGKREKSNFVKAAQLASTLDIQSEEVYEIRRKALWQMSAMYRNALGTKVLAKHYRLSKAELKEILETMSKEHRKEGNEEGFKPRCDLCRHFCMRALYSGVFSHTSPDICETGLV